MHRLVWLVLLLWPFFCAPAFADSDNLERTETEAASSVKLEEMVVTATRTETARDEAPASVSVITREEMEKINIKTIDEAIKYEVGLFDKRSKGIADSTPRVTMRGLPGQERTLVLLNGLPLNDGFSGSVQWNNLGIENVDRIEIIRGPASALYGGNAMGGAINIITSDPEKLEAMASAGYGSDDRKRFRGLAGDRWNNFTMQVGFGWEDTGGYASSLVTRSISSGTGTLGGGYPTTSTSDTPQWVVGDKGDNWAKRWNVNMRSSYEISETGKIAFDLQHGFFKYGYDEPHTYLYDSAGNPSFSGTVNAGDEQRASVSPGNYIYYTGVGEEVLDTYYLNYSDLFGGKLQFNAKVGLYDMDDWWTSNTASGSQNYDNAPGTLSDSNTLSVFTDLQSSLPLGSRHLLTFGLYFRYDGYDQDGYNLEYYQDESSKIEKYQTTQGKDSFYAVYLQDEWQILDQLTFYGGIRFDYWNAFDGKSGSVDQTMSFDEPSDYAFSPKFAAVWNPLADSYLRASIGRAFRAPNLYELYRTWQGTSSSYFSNPDLAPETLWNYEVGVEQYFWERKVNFSATYFHTDLSDAIERYKEGSDYFLDNVSDVAINGVELAGYVKPFGWLKLWANYTFNDSEVKKNERNPAAEGKELPGTPDHLVNVGTDFTYKWVVATLYGQYQGRIYSSELNDDKDDVYGGYSKRWLWNTKVTVTPVQHFFVSASVNNLFDEDYFDYYVGEGRNYIVEVGYKW